MSDDAHRCLPRTPPAGSTVRGRVRRTVLQSSGVSRVTWPTRIARWARTSDCRTYSSTSGVGATRPHGRHTQLGQTRRSWTGSGRRRIATQDLATLVGPADTVRFVANDSMFTGGDGCTVFYAREPTSSSRVTRARCRRRLRELPDRGSTRSSTDGSSVRSPATVARRPRAGQRGRSGPPFQFPSRRTIDGVTPDLEATLKHLPDRPGVYLMKDERGDVVYVGKAQSLRNRVRSYWQKATPAGEIHRIRSVIDRVAEVEYTLTDSVSEALLLEANLIKRFKPRFNVRLKDDKSYPYIKITLGDDFPRVERTRKLANDGSRYFGPYASAVERRRIDEPRPPALPVPDLHDRHQGRRAGAPAAVPAVPHQALPGPVHRGHLEGRLPRRHRAGRAVPRGSPGDAGQGARATRWRAAAERTDYERAAVAARQDPRHRADDGEPEDGGVRQDRARPGRPRPRRTTRPPSSCSRSATGRWSGATSSCSTRRARPATTRSSPASSSSTTPARPRSRARSTCRGSPTTTRTSRRSSPIAAAARSTSRSPSAARSAS